MSTKDGKVRFSFRKRRNGLILGGLIVAQFVLTIVLSVSLAANIIWPEGVRGATAAPVKISYEGRLTDASGNALGGTGSPYCYRFSIYDAATAGNKLWPPGTPSVTTATTTDGVFSAVIGQSDTLSSTVFDFSTTSTAYLQVDVSTSSPTCASNVESLTPRQQVLSSAYAMTANNLGSQLASDQTNGRIQTGSGTGAVTPVYFGLDWKNTAEYVGQTCTTNGLMWYNSSQSQALVCEGGIIERIGNSTTTVPAIGTGLATTTGAVSLANSNGVTFGINGNTITASVANAGAYTNSIYENMAAMINTVALQVSNNSTSVIMPFVLPSAESISFIRFPVLMSVSSVSYLTAGNTTFSGSIGQSINLVIYSMGTGANSASLQSVGSASLPFMQQYSLQANSNSSQYSVSEFVTFPSGSGSTASTSASYATSVASFQLNTGSLSNFNGARYLDFPFVSSLSAGNYWLAYGISTTFTTQYSNALSNNRIVFSNIAVSQINSSFGLIGSTGNVSNNLAIGLGGFSTNAVSTASIAFSKISSVASQNKLYFQMINMS